VRDRADAPPRLAGSVLGSVPFWVAGSDGWVIHRPLAGGNLPRKYQAAPQGAIDACQYNSL